MLVVQTIGSAPDISGQGIVNPIGTITFCGHDVPILSWLPKEAVLDGGAGTKDLGGSLGTKEVGDAVVAELVKILKA